MINPKTKRIALFFVGLAMCVGATEIMFTNLYARRRVRRWSGARRGGRRWRGRRGYRYRSRYRHGYPWYGGYGLWGPRAGVVITSGDRDSSPCLSDEYYDRATGECRQIKCRQNEYFDPSVGRCIPYRECAQPNSFYDPATNTCRVRWWKKQS